MYYRKALPYSAEEFSVPTEFSAVNTLDYAFEVFNIGNRAILAQNSGFLA